ncbi:MULTISPECIES: Scr1 family TA system antitoxin-like transcriptional regulator [unclassified Streptomyces]|uniref:helix-turn-helix domain-containing protein n=1 Tax=unclassified Streptomyces TaxID=2593676 RepID=UPI0016607F69|nr:MULTISPECIES: Scr1 family TA system antitoxin-like transcriptional regulator [unclassified Streptomyces]MBD0709565.1 transcriptional regulator [Streptomyces sp. CBMA291]MBD0715272.1 transcriptional regulator [Streptomyces sp. CBMA370]MBD0717886.1 transcriptional regulator [Streptomyces sp. CBMA370]
MTNRKELDATASPRAAYGVFLRRLRDQRGWTQDDLADRSTYSSQHISAVETARKSPTLRFSVQMDEIFETKGTADSLEREWQKTRPGPLLEGFPEYVAIEGKAVEIRLFEIGIIPGLLQTPEYARCLADGDVHRGSISTEGADRRMRYLTERQAALAHPTPPMLLIVLDESCIRRQVGGLHVMADQLDRLLSVAERANSVVQIAPYGIGEHRAFDMPINLLTLPDMSVLAYAESQLRGHMDRNSKSVLRLLMTYHQLQAAALPHAASVAMIREARKAYP